VSVEQPGKVVRNPIPRVALIAYVSHDNGDSGWRTVCGNVNYVAKDLWRLRKSACRQVPQHFCFRMYSRQNPAVQFNCGIVRYRQATVGMFRGNPLNIVAVCRPLELRASNVGRSEANNTPVEWNFS
jgi:hypothetical protein